MQPLFPPDACNAKRVPPCKGQPSFQTRLLWGTHSGAKGQKPKAEYSGRCGKDEGQECPVKVRNPEGNVICHRQPLRLAFPRLFPGGPAPPSPVGREPPGRSHVEEDAGRGSLESQSWEEVSGSATWAFSSFPSPPRTSAPRGRGADAAVTDAH